MGGSGVRGSHGLETARCFLVKLGFDRKGDDQMTTVDFEPLTIKVPLREDPTGVLRIGKSRVLLELVLDAFKAGATPESIVQSYDTLNLADVSAAIAYFHRHRAEVEQYLCRREAEAEVLRRDIEASQPGRAELKAAAARRTDS